MAFTTARLLAALDLASDGDDAFLGLCPEVGWRRIFGGLVIAQALVAVSRTVRDRPPHSLHAYFMLPGDTAVPVHYAVERLRDGGSISTRRCVATQNGRPIFSMSASFHAPEAGGLDHAIAMPPVPPPEDLAGFAAIQQDTGGLLRPEMRAFIGRDAPIEVRPVDLGALARHSPAPAQDRQAIWIRATDTLPDDPGAHRALLSYLSDATLLGTTLLPHGRSVFDADLQVASLDHALWFHRPFRVDDWLLYDQVSPSGSGALGFAQGSVFRRDGTLVASVAQQGLIRRRAPATPPA